MQINEYNSFWILFMDSIPLQMQIDRAFFENKVNSGWLACTAAILPACAETGIRKPAARLIFKL
jgi:hypothetical protein